MSNKVRIGILGCGPRGLQMAGITKLLDDCCELTCMSDPDEKALARTEKQFPGCALYASSDELLDSGRADAVITEIPPSVHTEYVVKALERNIHVLGEIPAVETLEEAGLLWKKVQASKATYMCGANANYRVKTPFALQLRDMGLLGKVAYVETEYMHDMRTLKDNWRKTYESCRYCTHSLGPVLALLGDDEVATVSCMSTGDIINCGRSHNAMSALFQTRKGVVIRFLTAFALPQRGPHHTTRILCEKGILELYNEKARLWLKDMNRFSAKNDFLEIPFTPNVDDRVAGIVVKDEALFAEAGYGHNGADNVMLRDFAEAILQKKEPPVGIREGLAMTLPGIFAAESARERGALKEIHYPWE